jgi:hypothetical protein
LCPPAEAAWTQFQGNARHDGNVGGDIGANAFDLRWNLSSSQLSGNVVPGVVADGDSAFLTVSPGKTEPYDVVCLNSRTGAENWRRGFAPYGFGLSEPSIGNGKVYVHQWGHSGVSGGNASQYPYVFGLDATTGEIDFATNHSGQWSSGSRPTVAGTQVFAAGGYYGGLDAYNGVGGAKSWFANVNQQYGWIPAADDERVYVYMGAASASPGPPTGRLYAFQRSSGASAFTVINTDDTWTSNTSSVVVGSQGNVLAFSRTQQGIKLVNFDIVTQSVTWRTPGTFNGRIAVDDGTIFAPNGIELSLFDESTGNKLDSWFAPAGESLQGNLIVSDDLIIAQTQQSTYAIRRSDLTNVWSTPLTGDLAYSDRTLFISYHGGVSAFAAVPEPTGFGLLVSVGLVLLCRSGRVRQRITI